MKEFILGVFLLIPAAAFAQRAADFERVLLPVVLTEPIPGAHGSLWTTEVWIHNSGDVPVHIRYSECRFTCEETFSVPAHTTLMPPLGQTGPGQRPGELLWVPKEQSPAVTFNLRAQDLSRQASTWGTEIPVIRESEFLTTAAQLLNVPTTDAFRQTLRVYDSESRAETQFDIRVYDQNTNVLLGQQMVNTSGAGHPPPFDMPRFPGTAEFPLSSVVALEPSVTRVRVEVIPLTPGVRFWAFVSVTNNETQHVTLVTPQ